MRESDKQIIRNVNKRLALLINRAPARSVFMVFGIVAFAVVGASLLVGTRAATPVTSYEAESATRSGSATINADANASAGQALQFTAVTSESRCPAYPAFPDSSCTGVLPGTTLANCSSNITQVNAVYDKCLFAGGLLISSTAKNVTITNSRIMGTVSCSNSNCTSMGLSMTDVEIDGQATNFDGIGGIMGYTCKRCDVHHVSKGFAGGNFWVEDSYVHDIYGSGDTHNEAVLPFNGNNNTMLHNNFDSNWSSNSTGGGMSAAIALYTHGTFWGPINNVLIEKNRITTSVAYYCMYGGNTTDADGDPSNLRVIDNVFGTCSINGPKNGAIVGWLRGNGNLWQNNTWQDGSEIPEPTTTNYQ